MQATDWLSLVDGQFGSIETSVESLNVKLRKVSMGHEWSADRQEAQWLEEGRRRKIRLEGG